MSDTTAFLAGCATTGVAALLLVLARASVDETAPLLPNSANNFAEEAIAPPLQVPPPPVAPTTNSDLEEQLRRELESQQDMTTDLETQLKQQELLIRTLEEKLDGQQQNTQATLAQLQEYQQSLTELSLNQNRSAEVGSRSETQTLVLWLGAGFLLALILGGGVVLIVLLIMVSQSQRRSPRSYQMVYPPSPPPPPYRYYEQEFLPPPTLYPRRTEAHDPYDFR
ncbi:MAG: hypothetical protein ACTS3T_18885 [Almyronema sp.]